MRILVIGSGGREHALCWKLAQSSLLNALYVTPGNGGTSAVARNVAIPADDIIGLHAFAKKEAIDLTVVGPEQPLVAGLVDVFEKEGLPIVGPSAKAAQLEGSKAYAKAFMGEFGIPTARYRTFPTAEYEEARAYVDGHAEPLVIKASGLAAGKGAFVCQTRGEALEVLDEVMREHSLGEAGDEVVVEEFMAGEEASVFALSDGDRYVLLPSAQDHKRLKDGDEGPNTGGMGAYTPAPAVTPQVLQQVCTRIIEPTLAGMKSRSVPYRGFLYCGLMLTDEGPKVVEFNCRLGDPEAQVVLPLIENDLADVLQKLAQRRLNEVSLRIQDGSVACVVMASGGYPGSYEKGFVIEGLEDVEEAEVFHAGTKRKDTDVVTNGGRVLGVTAKGRDLKAALDKAYAAADQISFKNTFFRRDIGQKGLMLLLVLLTCMGAQAQTPADTLVTLGEPTAVFEEAEALALAPQGVIYVADAGLDAIIRLRLSNGTLAAYEREELGGPGYDSGAFFNPADIDPTNGQVLVVADAGNHRIQRFSDEFRLLEELPVATEEMNVSRLESSARTIPSSAAQGRPISVAAAPNGAVYAIDAATGSVIKWNADRSVAWVRGGSNDPLGRLVEPVELALSEKWLFVADRGRRAVLVYDHFGNYARQLSYEREAPIQSIFIADEKLYFVLPKALLIYSVEGRRLGAIQIEQQNPLVDAARLGNKIWLLTETALFAVPLSDETPFPPQR